MTASVVKKKAERADPILINKKKRTCQLEDFDISMDHTYRGKNKESKNINKYLDLARELKNLWNIKVTVILIVIGALGETGDQRKNQIFLADSNVKADL